MFIVHRFLNTSRGPKILFLPANIAVASRVHAVINISIIHVQLPQLCTRSKTVSSCCVLKKANVKDVSRKGFFFRERGRGKKRKLAFQRLWESSCGSYVKDLAFVEKSCISFRQSSCYCMSLCRLQLSQLAAAPFCNGRCSAKLAVLVAIDWLCGAYNESTIQCKIS